MRPRGLTACNATGMGRFLAGFAVATLLWGGIAAVYLLGGLGREPEATLAAERPDGSVDAGPDATPRGRRRRAGRRRPGGAAGRRAAGPTGEATTGDDLDDSEPREVDLGAEGGEQQLSSAQVDEAFGQAMPRVRRCVLLAPEDAAIRGRVVFGLRIRGNGQVGGVRLSGPAALTTGEAGACMQAAARAVRFPSFDGPDMVVSYPVTFD